MPSFTKQDNPHSGRTSRKCADKFCGLFFCPTEDIRQLYCSKSCKKRVQNRKREARKAEDQLIEFLYPTRKTVKEIIMHNENHSITTTPTPPENISLRYLRESLAWNDRQISEGVREVDQKMDALSRQIKSNNELLKKKKELVDAIAILERNL